jgi:hypothetical protein
VLLVPLSREPSSQHDCSLLGALAKVKHKLFFASNNDHDPVKRVEQGDKCGKIRKFKGGVYD